MTGLLRRLVPVLVLLAAAAVGVRKAVALAKRDLAGPPMDRSGAGMALPQTSRSVGRVGDAHVVARAGEPEWVRDLAGWTPRAPSSPLGRLLAVLWASPSTLMGLLIGLVSGAAPTVRDGVLLFAPVRGPVRMALRRTGYAATTLGHVVLAVDDPSPALMAHELVHTRQAERLGPLMGPVYWYLLARYGYARHPMERAARIAGRTAAHALAGHARPERGVHR